MKINKISSVIFGSCALALSDTAHSSLVVNIDPNPQQNVASIGGFEPTGADMDGMHFTITYADNTTTSAIWTDTGSKSGMATWNTGSMTVIGDTYTADWNLTDSRGIKSIFIDAVAGNTIFDTNLGANGDDKGTPGSEMGTTFSLNRRIILGITATYSGAIGVGGANPVGDIFRFLKIEFSSAFTGGVLFKQDTDNININPVPVPAAVWLFGSGLLGLMGLQRKRPN